MRRTLLDSNWRFWDRSRDAQDQKLGYSTLERHRATVPGHVHTDLMASGVLADPFQLMQELGSQWVDERSWSYCTELEWAPSDEHPRRILRFDGLDTVCTVALNGLPIAESNNMFVAVEVDVSALLKVGTNTLEVHFEPAQRVGEERARKYFRSEGLLEPLERFDSRSFVRKAQYMYGWDWGPRLISAGVWQPVWLEEFSARLSDVHVRQLHRADGSVDLEIKTEQEGSARVVHVLDRTRVQLGDGTLRLQSPRLWYPSGLGEQALYELWSFLVPEALDVAGLSKDPSSLFEQLEAAALDQRVTQLGLRTARLLQEVDELGRSFEFEINGRSLWVMGVNWIPDHSFPSRIGSQALQERLRAAQRAGINMLRVWGGGLYETDEFYRLCDELGLLVWQDFPFACAYYPDTGSYADEVATEAAANVRRLRNHASLVLWCGNNENQQMRTDRWGKSEQHPPRFYGERLYDEVLPGVLAKLDPERPYVSSSPSGGENPNSGGTGDQHYWDVWHGRGDWVHYRDSQARFSSEYGFASSCSLAAWHGVFKAVSGGEAARVAGLPVRDPAVRWHDKTGKGQETFLGFVALHYPSSHTLADWVYYSQLNQRDAIRAAIEHYRRSKFCSGSLIWQINDCWPVQSWALIDSLGHPKPAFYELNRLYAPGLVSIELADDTARVWGILDNADPTSALHGPVVLEAFALATGERVWQRTADGHVKAGQRQVLLESSINGLEKTETLLVARFADRVAYALLDEPKHLHLPAPAPISLTAISPGQFRVRCETPLVDLVFTENGGTKTFPENVFTRPNPGAFLIRYEGKRERLEARSLAGSHELKLWG